MFSLGERYLCTFLARYRILVGRLLFLLLAAQVTGVHRHRGLNLLLGQLHALVEHLEELLRLVVARQPCKEGSLCKEGG